MIDRILPFVVIAAFASSGAAAADAGNVAAGKAIFGHICQNCHAIEIGINKVGPSLWDVVGRPAASVPGYDYSDGMKGNKTPWTGEALDAYLADPRGDVHGAKMFFKGLHEPKDRADVIAYLATLK
jgi:cytochrome c